VARPPSSDERLAESKEDVLASVGFIGLGNMGSLMARNLIRAGHSLKVYDLFEEAVNFVSSRVPRRHRSIGRPGSD
jgi:3-hydroxyisobutyrate dehydrogenase